MDTYEKTKASFYGVYQKAFFSKAYKEGLITPLDIGDETIDVNSTAEWEYDVFYKYNSKKTSVLQMFLLFEEITLIDASVTYDYSQLKSTGLIEVITIDEEPSLMGQQDLDYATCRYAMHLKPMILPRLMKTLTKNDKAEIKNIGLRPRVFLSVLFDLIVLPSESMHTEEEIEKGDKFVKSHNDRVYKKQKKKWDSMSVSEEQARQFIVNRWLFLITEAVGTLMSLLDQGKMNNSIILQNEFRVERGAEANERSFDVTNTDVIESYKIIKLSCENAIGTLPKLNTIEDVLRLKETRRNDIQRLRSAISEVEFSLREGHSKAVKRSNELVSKAASDLSKGLELQRVSKWSTYMSLPVASIEMWFGMPPVAGLTVGTIGTASTFGSVSAADKNNWISVVR